MAVKLSEMSLYGPVVPILGLHVISWMHNPVLMYHCVNNPLYCRFWLRLCTRSLSSHYLNQWWLILTGVQGDIRSHHSIELHQWTDSVDKIVVGDEVAFPVLWTAVPKCKYGNETLRKEVSHLWQWEQWYISSYDLSFINPWWWSRKPTTRSEAWFNIKMSSYQYRKSHCGDKTAVRSSYLHNGISNTGKMTSLYWFRPQLLYFNFIYLKSVVIQYKWSYICDLVNCKITKTRLLSKYK